MKKMINERTGEITHYLYDANGNLVEKYRYDDAIAEMNMQTTECWEYEYTVDDKLKTVSHNGVAKARFWHDADRNRIQSWTEEEGVTNYVYSFGIM